MAYNNKFYLGEYVRILEINELLDKKSDNKAWINSVNVTGETPLHIAARRRILDLFESMLPYYNDIETCDDQDNTVLHRLVDSNIESDEENRQKRIDLLRILISKNADVNKKNKHGSTSVHLAAKHCHLELLKILKEAGADFNLRTNDGETALLLSCENMFKLRGTDEEIDIIDFLLNCNCDINATDDEGYSALHYAVEFCSGRIVEKLVDAGVDLHLRTFKYDLTPLHLAAKKMKSTKAEILLKGGAIEKSEDEVAELTPLHTALLEGSAEVVDKLIDYGSDLNYPETNLGFTSLHVSVYQKRFDLFQLLVDKGADVNYSGKDGLTPLHLSSMLGDVEFAKALIDHSADLNCRDQNEFTPLHIAIRKDFNYDRDLRKIVGVEPSGYKKKKTLIDKLLICKHHPVDEDYEAVVRLLIDSGADVNAVTKDGESALYLAVKNNILNILKILLEKEADVNQKVPDTEFTALHLAAYNHNKDAIQLLLEAKADVNALTKDGKNSLHLAIESKCRTKSTEILSLLVEHEINVNWADNLQGFTPLHQTVIYHFDGAPEFLINAGADVNSLTNDGENYETLKANVIDIMKVNVEK